MSDYIHHTIHDTHFYQSYHRDTLKQAAVVDNINGWHIEYLAFSRAETAHNPPVVILGGAFQNFNSYKYCIEPLLDNAPVILVDLPALGSNEQIYNHTLKKSSLDLSMPQLSTLLGWWINAIGLTKLSMMGMSLGSVIAANFAHQFTEKLHRLVLMGVMRSTRKSWRMLIEASLTILDENHMQAFGEAVVLYLVNHAKLEQTKMSAMARRLFHEQITNFNDNEKTRYRINANRLLKVDEVPLPTCPTLVATGQYDSFTLPFENAAFAASCPNAQFALIENADHVPQLQKRRQTLNLFVSYLKGQAINNLSGITELKHHDMLTIERRSAPRYVINEPYVLTHRLESSWHDTVMLMDVSFFGLLFAASSIEQAANMMAMSQDLAITLQDEQGVFTIELLLFEQKGRKIRALFKHGCFKTVKRLQNYLTDKAFQLLDTAACG